MCVPLPPGDRVNPSPVGPQVAAGNPVGPRGSEGAKPTGDVPNYPPAVRASNLLVLATAEGAGRNNLDMAPHGWGRTPVWPHQGRNNLDMAPHGWGITQVWPHQGRNNPDMATPGGEGQRAGGRRAAGGRRLKTNPPFSLQAAP